MHTAKQGSMSLGVAVGCLSKLGYVVSIPLNDVQKYDLVVDFGDGKTYTVQVKSTTRKVKDSWRVQIKSVRTNTTKNVIHTFDNTKVDFLLVVCDYGEEVYLIPSKEVAVKNELTIKVGQADWRLHRS